MGMLSTEQHEVAARFGRRQIAERTLTKLAQGRNLNELAAESGWREHELVRWAKDWLHTVSPETREALVAEARGDVAPVLEKGVDTGVSTTVNYSALFETT